MSDIVITYLTATMEAILEPKKDTKIGLDTNRHAKTVICGLKSSLFF